MLTEVCDCIYFMYFLLISTAPSLSIVLLYNKADLELFYYIYTLVTPI